MHNIIVGKLISLPIAILILLILFGCSKKTIILKSVDLFTDIYTDKSRYTPGESVQVYVNLFNSTDELQSGKVNLKLKYIDQMIMNIDPQEVTMEIGERTSLTFNFIPPKADYKGYIIEASFIKNETVVDVYSSAVDVSSDWTKYPRYGYLVSYGKKSQGMIDSIMADLNKYHINGLQFYDWQYKHEKPLPLNENLEPLEKWLELSNREVYASTVSGYIDAAHAHNMMAMNYNLLFGTYDNPEIEGVNLEWGLFTDQNGEHIDYHPLPNEWQSSKLLLMNPFNTDWQNFIFEQEQIALTKMNFDGWHVDQLGYRGDRYDYQGNKIDLEASYIDLLNNAKNHLNTRLIFNAVDGYAQDRIARELPVDFLYQEVWTPQKYSDLKRIIDNGFDKTDNQKSMILAAYMNYGKRNNPGSFNMHSILLTNATIFASGGAHLELGDTGMLSSEYFPSNNLKMSLELKQRLRRYYDFLVAYQNLLRDNVSPAMARIEIDQVKTSSLGMKDAVWYFGKEKDNYQIFHLINVLGNDVDWRDDEQDKIAPQILENVEVKIYINDDVKKVLLASPDNFEGLTLSLDFKNEISNDGEKYISFILPSLEYWDMIILEK